MNILHKLTSKIKSLFNGNISFNFDGGDITSDAGLSLMADFIHAIGFKHIVEKHLNLKNDKANRCHTNVENTLQHVMQNIGGYHHQDNADDLMHDPLFAELLAKEKLASQPTMSRFMNRLTLDTAKQFETINMNLLDQVYEILPPKEFLIDVDSTMTLAFGKQHGSSYNKHYASKGFHPLTAFNGTTGDFLKVENRSGNVYTLRNIVRFMSSLIDHYRKKFPHIPQIFRADSGFALPQLYMLLEAMNCRYCIRLKSNNALMSLGYEAVKDMMCEEQIHKEYLVYREFEYQAGTWNKKRRVVVKIYKPASEMLPKSMTFYVTNLEMTPADTVLFYNQRGTSENMIKEAKNGFRMDKVSYKNFDTNTNQMQLSMLAYNLVNSFKRLVLPTEFSGMQVETLRNKLFKIGAKKVKAARQLTYKMASSYPHQAIFSQTHDNIRRLAETG